MRKEFFATFLHDQQSDTIGTNPAAVREGDQIDHVGDVITDICLIKNGLMDYKVSRALYGLNWQMAQELISTQTYFHQSSLPTALSNTLPLVHPPYSRSNEYTRNDAER